MRCCFFVAIIIIILFRLALKYLFGLQLTLHTTLHSFSPIFRKHTHVLTKVVLEEALVWRYMALLLQKETKRQSGRRDGDTAAAWSMSETLDLFSFSFTFAQRIITRN